MNKKTLAAGFLTAVIASSVLLTSSASAFWPFDSLFNKGSVKAATTDRVAAPRPPVAYIQANSHAKQLSVALAKITMACKELYMAETPKPNTGNQTTKSYAGRTYAETAEQKKVTTNGWNETAGTNKALSAINEKAVEVIYATMKTKCADIQALSDRMVKLNVVKEEPQTTTNTNPERLKTDRPVKNTLMQIFNGRKPEAKPVEVESDGAINGGG